MCRRVLESSDDVSTYGVGQYAEKCNNTINSTTQ